MSAPKSQVAGDLEDIFRHELKFLIPIRLIDPIKHYLSTFCQPDPNSKAGGYTIVSLYLDTPYKKFYRDTRRDLPYRKKLRVRGYTKGDSEFCLFEIKKKMRDLVHKSRTQMSLKDLARFNQPAFRIDRLQRSASTKRSLDKFNSLISALNCEPNILVRYHREAFESIVDDYARVTFDRDICYQPHDQWNLNADENAWRPLDLYEAKNVGAKWAILELKSSLEVPLWMVDLIHQFGLNRTGFSKYAESYEQSVSIDDNDLFDLLPSEITHA